MAAMPQAMGRATVVAVIVTAVAVAAGAFFLRNTSVEPAADTVVVNTQVPRQWLAAWPNTDFSRSSVDFREIISGGVPKDRIRAINQPKFAPIADVTDLAGTEPVIGLIVDGEAKAYPLSILIRHEIVNDVIAGVPVAVTFCPLCNTAVVFDARVGGDTLNFGVSGNLRNSDLLMFDRQTESWWQQFTGEAVVGEFMGTELKMLPSRLESWDNFRARAPAGALVQVADGGSYGRNPYAFYDTAAKPFLYRGPLPDEIPALARVVKVERADGTMEGWSLELLRAQGRIEAGDLVLTWEPGQNSALDQPLIADGADVGNVLVQRNTADGLVDVVYGVDFAFAFRAFFPEAPLHQ